MLREWIFGRRDVRDLLRAAVAAPDAARDGWARWAARHPLDRVSWEELRLLGAVVGRGPALRVRAADKPRLTGIRRFVWSCTQARLAAARPVLAGLAEAGVPFALLKGAALVAAGHLSAGDRYLRDVDVLVPRGRLGDAVDVLLGAGWRPPRFPSRDEVFSLGFPRLHAVDFEAPGGRRDQIDLHLCASELDRSVRGDAGLWARVGKARLLGLPVLVPAPEDLLCLCLLHSYVSDRESGQDWAIDAAALARRPDFDWRLLLAEARRRGAELIVRERLRQLVDLRALALPEGVARELEAIRPEPAFAAELAALSRPAWRRFGIERIRRHAAHERACRALVLGGGRPPEAPALPAPSAWLRMDVPIPVGLPPTGHTQRLALSGRIHRARVHRPIRYRLYCGSQRLGGGGTLPLVEDGSHRFRAEVALDPMRVAAEGRPPLSLYLGRRSRDTGVLGPESSVEVTRVAWL